MTLLALLWQQGGLLEWFTWERVLMFVIIIGSAVVVLWSRKSEATDKAQEKALDVQTKLAVAQEKRAALAETERDANDRKASKLQEDLDTTILEYKELVQVDMQEFITNYKEMARICKEVLQLYADTMQAHPRKRG